MLIGTVVGNVWATKKDPTLAGLRFLVIQPFTLDGKPSAETVIAVDPLGAGIGERVLVVFGRAARHAIGKGHDVGFQSADLGAVDEVLALDHVGDGGIDLRLDRQVLGLQIDERNHDCFSCVM